MYPRLLTCFRGKLQWNVCRKSASNVIVAAWCATNVSAFVSARAAVRLTPTSKAATAARIDTIGRDDCITVHENGWRVRACTREQSRPGQGHAIASAGAAAPPGHNYPTPLPACSPPPAAHQSAG